MGLFGSAEKSSDFDHLVDDVIAEKDDFEKDFRQQRIK